MVKKKSSKIVSIINKYKENSDIQIYKEEINNILDKKKKNNEKKNLIEIKYEINNYFY